MLLLVGLGNPGQAYAGNRHNLGFMAVEAIANAHGFGPWRTKFQGVIAEGQIGAARCLALKPQTFMNESGRAVALAASFYKLPPQQIVVFYDELDLAPGRLRMKKGGGAAGHNGIRSICASAVGADFRRARLGIGHPGEREKVHAYVLSNFAKSEAAWVEALCLACAAEAPLLAAGDDEAYQAKVLLRAPAAKHAVRPAQAEE